MVNVSGRTSDADLANGRVWIIFSQMRKTREIAEEKVPSERSEGLRNQSDDRLRQLLKEAQKAADPQRKARLKQEFLREFYEGSR